MVSRWRAPIVVLLVGMFVVGALQVYRWIILRDACPPGASQDYADTTGCTVVFGLQVGLPTVLSYGVGLASLAVAATLAIGLRRKNEPR